MALGFGPVAATRGQATAAIVSGRADTVIAPTSLDSLLARARVASPRLEAARSRVDAALARVGPAGARPDPMLMAGIQNFPVSEPGFDDFMTMKMIGASQTLPYPGKLSLRRRAADSDADAARAELEGMRLDIERDVKTAYFELAYADRALEIVERNSIVLLEIIKATEVRYETGSGSQQDVLRARVEAARLGEDATAVREARWATLARLNALLDLPSQTPVNNAQIPTRITRAAVGDSTARILFATSILGSRTADSPLPPLDSLQDLAVRRSPILRVREAGVAAQRARAELARREHLPDADVSLQYGQRKGLSDMVTAIVSVPLPLQRRTKQKQLLAETRAQLAALVADRHAEVNELRSEVARLHADLERDRAQLALYVMAIIPQGRAVLESTITGYKAGRADYISLLDARATLFNYDTAYFRTLTSFAKTLAELEGIVGVEVLQ